MMSKAVTEITVRRATVDDIPELQDFYQQTFPDKPVLHDMPLWKWSFVDNPDLSSGNAFFVAEQEGRIRGGIGYLAMPLLIDGHKVSAGHPVNFFVADEFKGMPAVRLMRMMLDDCPYAFTSYMSADAIKIFSAAGFVDLSPYLKNYHYFLDSSRIRSFKSRLIQWARHVWSKGLYRWLHLKYGTRVLVEVKEHFEPACMPQDIEPGPEYLGVARTAQFIDWRYEKSPRLDCKYFVLKLSGKVRLLAVVHFDKQENKAVILDITGQQDDVWLVAYLLLEILRYCRQNKVDFVISCALNSRMHKAFMRAGFGSATSSFSLFVFSKKRKHRAIMAAPEKWDFFIGHSDVF